MSAKAPFTLSDYRIYDVTEYCACYEEWDWEDELVIHYSVMQRVHKLLESPFDPKELRKRKIVGVSGHPFSFMVIMSVEAILEVFPKLPPPEAWLVEVARYQIRHWLEANGMSAHHHNHQRPIILRPFS